jgi:hypothetical protein
MSTSPSADKRAARGFVPTTALARLVEFNAEEMRVHLTDGRTLTVPLAWFPTLLAADQAARQAVEIGGGGRSLHWPALDEDLSVAGLLAGGDQDSM